MPFTIVHHDITKLKVDAVVNAANTELKMGGGVCRAIFRAAGARELQAACDKLAPIKTGEAVITPGFNLPAKYVIHAAGPIYPQPDAERLLRSAYRASLRLAYENRCESVAFPLISSGIYGYPKDEALKVAVSAIRDFLSERDMDVTLVIFDKSAYAVTPELLSPVQRYIDTHYTGAPQAKRGLEVRFQAAEAAETPAGVFMVSAATPSYGAPESLEDLVGHLDEPFSQMLLRLIDAKGMTDVEVYKRANLDRRLFSKIRSNKGYLPSKRTAVALAVALRLSLDETHDFLRRAGFALSRASKFDVIVEYFIASGRYDVFEINEVLFKYDQPLLGG